MPVQLPEQFNDVQVQRQRLLVAVEKFLPAQNDLIGDVLALAEKAHVGQARDDGRPYVIHPIRVARTLLEEMGERDANIIAAALLHDVVEDTSVRLEEIYEQFGPQIAKLVESVTRPRANSETEEDKLTSKPKNYQKILNSPNETIRIKAADILDNMRGWVAAEDVVRVQGKLPRWLNEAREWYVRIGRMAGHGIEEKMQEIVAYFEK